MNLALMSDAFMHSADDMYSEALAERVRALKETPKGVDTMYRELEKIYTEGRTEVLPKPCWPTAKV